MKKTYRCAIVGLTNIASGPITHSLGGGRHVLPYSHASALAEIPNAQVVAICDIVPAMIEKFQTTWAGVWDDVKTYTDVNELLANEEIDILGVCTPDNLHTEIVVNAADRGIPAILCEKPLATTLEDADRMIEAVDRNNTICSVEHTRRWDPFFYRAKELIDAGIIGEVQTVTGTMHSARAMIFRNGTHLIDLMCFYAGAAPTHVFAEVEPGFEDFKEYSGDGGHAPSSEPSASAYIRFANGVRGFFDSHKKAVSHSEWIIAGTKGRIAIGPDKAELYVHNDEVGEVVQRTFPAQMMMTGAIQGAYEEIIAVLEGKQEQVRSTPRDARMTVSILEGILRSQQEGNRLIELR